MLLGHYSQQSQCGRSDDVRAEAVDLRLVQISDDARAEARSADLTVDSTMKDLIVVAGGKQNSIHIENL
ncbi:hypothetical protein L484_007904 [Morus notabilis]|uniref:Uncharacterized protein n=1 Tax=Morus notabilis TaxID=981085 RepID=W9QSL5_9ROSA|nr:hypothetical protein L484_007904 [Morus notabilis]